MKRNFLNTVMLVERDKKNQIIQMEFYFSEEDGDVFDLPREERLDCGILELDYSKNKGKFFDGSMGGETYNNGIIEDFVLHQVSKESSKISLAKWAQRILISHLKYRARVYCRDFFDENPNDHLSLKNSFEKLKNDLDYLQKEENRIFDLDYEAESFVAFWALAKIYLGEVDNEILSLFYKNMPVTYSDHKNNYKLINELLKDKIDPNFLLQIKED